MSHVGVPRGTVRKRRTLALLATGVLTIPALAGCTSSDRVTTVAIVVPQDVAAAGRDLVADGGTVNWAIDAMPTTFNAFQADADATTTRITGALLPTLFPLDTKGTPRMNPDYLESAKVIEREPKQVVLYRLNQQAVWSDGREIGAPDFVAQWRALRGKDSAFWTARNMRLRPDRADRARQDRPGGPGHLCQTVRGLALPLLPAVPEAGHQFPGRVQRPSAHHARGHFGTVPAAQREEGRGHRHPDPQPELVGQPGQARLAGLPGGQAAGPGPGTGRRQGRHRGHRRSGGAPDRGRGARQGRERPAAHPRPGLRDRPRRRTALLGPGARLRREGRGGRPGEPGGDPESRGAVRHRAGRAARLCRAQVAGARLHAARAER